MPRLIILSGPSCVGKGPLLQALRRVYPEIIFGQTVRFMSMKGASRNRHDPLRKKLTALQSLYHNRILRFVFLDTQEPFSYTPPAKKTQNESKAAIKAISKTVCWILSP